MSKSSGWSLSLIATAFVLRVGFIFRYRFDSDEPQHMHVAWGWAHGLVQYRDVFDNHMPLFHLLSAPLFAFTGDDPRLLFAARLAMLPLWLLTLAGVWFIARRLFDATTAWWSVAGVALIPPFFLGSLEYRTDDLWVALWVAIIATAVSRMPLNRKALIGGLLLGAAFGVSMKSPLFAIAIGGALLVTPLLTLRRGPLPPRRDIVRAAVIAIAAMAIIPALIFAGFFFAGAWKPFVYGVFVHNRLPFEHLYKLLFFALLYPIVRTIAALIARSNGDDDIVRLRLFVFLACGIYETVLVCFWPMAALESYLPVYPLAVLLATPLFLRRAWLPPIAAIAMIVAVIGIGTPWRNEAQHEIALVDEVIAMTEPADPVMDLKGETVFRMRPYYLVLEAITNVKMRVGILRDQIADTLVRSRTHVVATDQLPPHAAQFVARNYVRWGGVHVAGVHLPASMGNCSPFDISLAIPGPYIVAGERGILRASIDGIEVGRGGVALASGRHRVVVYEAAANPMVVWAGTLRSARLASCRNCDSAHAQPFPVGR